MSKVSIENDEFRKSLDPSKGVVFLTKRVSLLPPQDRSKLLKLVQEFESFKVENDPYGEHDFGKVTMGSENFFWKRKIEKWS